MSTAPSRTLVRVLIADEHAIFRAALRRVLEFEPGFQVAGETGGNGEVVSLARELAPDILLMDIDTPWHTNLDAVRELSAPPNASRSVRTRRSTTCRASSTNWGYRTDWSWRCSRTAIASSSRARRGGPVCPPSSGGPVCPPSASGPTHGSAPIRADTWVGPYS